MLHRVKLLGLGTLARLPLLGGLALLLCAGFIIIAANGCGKKGGGGTSAGSSATPPALPQYTSSTFTLFGLVNNGFQDSNLWFGKYVGGILDTGTEEFIPRDLDISR